MISNISKSNQNYIKLIKIAYDGIKEPGVFAEIPFSFHSESHVVTFLAGFFAWLAWLLVSDKVQISADLIWLVLLRSLLFVLRCAL